MKKVQNIGIILLLTAAMNSCGNDSKNPVSGNSTENTSKERIYEKEEPLKGCYIGVLKRDTFQLAITAVDGNSVVGSLLYNFYEKDKSKGTIQGTFVNGVLLADYIFQSEGVTSVRQVIFKKTAKGFLEGYGNIKSEGGKEVFVDTASVSFDNSEELTRTEDCLP